MVGSQNFKTIQIKNIKFFVKTSAKYLIIVYNNK